MFNSDSYWSKPKIQVYAFKHDTQRLKTESMEILSGKC